MYELDETFIHVCDQVFDADIKKYELPFIEFLLDCAISSYDEFSENRYKIEALILDLFKLRRLLQRAS